MKDSHLTLRLPRELARALARWARERGRAKSDLVREAVAGYLAPAAASAARVLSAGELSARWRVLPRLTAPEAAGLGDAIAAARKALPAVRGAWE